MKRLGLNIKSRRKKYISCRQAKTLNCHCLDNEQKNRLESTRFTDIKNKTVLSLIRCVIHLISECQLFMEWIYCCDG